jgi:3-methylfumaryl-CoA hydratase
MPSKGTIDYSPWVGRTESRTQVIDVEHARRMATMLDLPDTLRPGDPLRPLWHWAYFTPLSAQSDLSPDGHPALGDFLPPIPLPRRMWAGGSLRFTGALRLGDEVERTTTILDVTEKEGRQGRLVFLVLGHRLIGGRGGAIDEEQSIVYRAAAPARPTDPARAAEVEPAERTAADWRETLVPDTRLLFRYSALTFNAHRIHYDQDYARNVEGYHLPVVQGPLTATLLVDRFLRRRQEWLAEFQFRAMAPLYVTEEMQICGAIDKDACGGELWAETPTGATAMSAKIRLTVACSDV